MTDERYPGHDSRYHDLTPEELPVGESLKDTMQRALKYWDDEIKPAILSGKRVLLSITGNTSRAVVKHLDNLSSDEVLNLNIPTGIPLVYELSNQLQPIKHYYLAEDEKLVRMIDEVKSQGKG